MLKKCRAIVLGTVNYSESSVILKCYTDLYGLQSYMINGIKGKKAAIKPSQLQPLTLLEMDVYYQQGKSLQRIKDLKCTPILNELHFELLKSAVGMFVAELIGKCLREENEEDNNLFEFVYSAIQILDITKESVANYPLFFMIQLSRYLGFSPKPNYSPERNSFSLHEGFFGPYEPTNTESCNPELSAKLFELMLARFDNFSTIQISHLNRMQLLDKLIRYYQLHLMVFSELKSPKVLKEVMT